MTPEEALRILDAAAGMAPLNRETHVKVQEASSVLGSLIKKVKVVPGQDRGSGATQNK